MHSNNYQSLLIPRNYRLTRSARCSAVNCFLTTGADPYIYVCTYPVIISMYICICVYVKNVNVYSHLNITQLLCVSPYIYVGAYTVSISMYVSACTHVWRMRVFKWSPIHRFPKPTTHSEIKCNQRAGRCLRKFSSISRYREHTCVYIRMHVYICINVDTRTETQTNLHTPPPAIQALQ